MSTDTYEVKAVCLNCGYTTRLEIPMGMAAPRRTRVGAIQPEGYDCTHCGVQRTVVAKIDQNPGLD